MSNFRIKENGGYIKDCCTARLFDKDDPKDVRDAFRQIILHVENILSANACASAVGEQDAIRIEKKLCAALGREWRPTGISVETLVDEMIARLQTWR